MKRCETPVNEDCIADEVCKEEEVCETWLEPVCKDRPCLCFERIVVEEEVKKANDSKSSSEKPENKTTVDDQNHLEAGFCLDEKIGEDKSER